MSSTNKFLSLVKSTITNISEYVGSTADPCLTKGLVDSSPAVYKSGSSFYFDYSTTTNTSSWYNYLQLSASFFLSSKLLVF